MNGTEILTLIGRPADVDLNGMIVRVRISDVKSSYGNIRYQVTPLSGSGSVWVDAGRVQLVTSEERNGQ